MVAMDKNTYVRTVLEPSEHNWPPDEFLRYGLDLQAADRQEIEAAISSVEAIWSSLSSHPIWAARVRDLLEKKQVARTLLDAKARAKLREDVEARRKTRAKRRYQDLDDWILTRSREHGGSITPGERDRLVALFADRLQEREVDARLRELNVVIKGRSQAEAGPPPASWRNPPPALSALLRERKPLREHLKILEHDSLRSFLGMGTGATSDAIKRKRAELESHWDKRGPTAQKTAAMALLEIATRFGDEPRTYALFEECEAEAALRPHVEEACRDGRVSLQEQDMLLRQAERSGRDRAFIQRLIDVVAHELGATVEQPPSSAPPQPTPATPPSGRAQESARTPEARRPQQAAKPPNRRPARPRLKHWIKPELVFGLPLLLVALTLVWKGWQYITRVRAPTASPAALTAGAPSLATLPVYGRAGSLSELAALWQQSPARHALKAQLRLAPLRGRTDWVIVSPAALAQQPSGFPQSSSMPAGDVGTQDSWLTPQQVVLTAQLNLRAGAKKSAGLVRPFAAGTVATALLGTIDGKRSELKPQRWTYSLVGTRLVGWLWAGSLRPHTPCMPWTSATQSHPGDELSLLAVPGGNGRRTLVTARGAGGESKLALLQGAANCSAKLVWSETISAPFEQAFLVPTAEGAAQELIVLSLPAGSDGLIWDAHLVGATESSWHITLPKIVGPAGFERISVEGPYVDPQRPSAFHVLRLRSPKIKGDRGLLLDWNGSTLVPSEHGLSLEELVSGMPRATDLTGAAPSEP